MLKGQDILVLLKLIANRDNRYTYYALAKSLGMSPSEVHAAIARLAKASFLHPEERIPNRASVHEFLVHGLRYVFPLERKFGFCRGMATAQGAPFVRSNFESNDDPPPVWPDSEGDIRGMGVLPVYGSAPKAARSDETLYRLLVLCDLLRGGQAREKEWAEKRLTEILYNGEPHDKYS